MTDREYAELIYCLVFDVNEDRGDTNTDNVLVAISALEERDRIALEARYRNGKRYRQIGMELGGVTSVRAAQITKRAIHRLCSSNTVQSMSLCGKMPINRGVRIDSR